MLKKTAKISADHFVNSSEQKAMMSDEIDTGKRKMLVQKFNRTISFIVCFSFFHHI